MESSSSSAAAAAIAAATLGKFGEEKKCVSSSSSSSSSSNPQFEICLMELYYESLNGPWTPIYEMCLESLRKYPLKLPTPQHCRILQGFAKSVIQNMEAKLKELKEKKKKKSSSSSSSSPRLPLLQLSPIKHRKPLKRPIIKEKEETRVIHVISSDDDDDEDIDDSNNGTFNTPSKPTRNDSNDLDSFLLSPLKEPTSISPPRITPPRITPPPMSPPLISRPLAAPNSISPPPNKKAKKRSTKTSNSSSGSPKKKEYVPKTGSGAYAILMTLYKESEKEGYVGHMTKKQICSLAQPLADESLTVPKPGRFNYTAWNGASILEKKSLIKSWSNNPKKFDLTDLGKDLAKRITNAEVSIDSSQSTTTTTQSHDYDKATSKSLSSTNTSSLESKSDPKIENSIESVFSHEISQPLPPYPQTQTQTSSYRGQTQSKMKSYSSVFDDASWLENKDLSNLLNPLSSSKLQYCYVSDFIRDVECDDQNKAEMDIDDYVSYMIKCRKMDLEKSDKRFHIKKTLEHGLVVAYVHELDLEEMSPLSTSKTLISSLPESSSKTSIVSPKSSSKKSKVPPKPSSKKSVKSSESTPQTSVGHESVIESPKRSKTCPVQRFKTNCQISNSNEVVVEETCDFRYWLNKSGNDEKVSRSTIDSSNSSLNICYHPEFTFEPGEFDIILLVDTGESEGGKTGGKKSRREVTINELKANAVPYETRNLNLGDYLWIAREKAEIDCNSYKQNKRRELVLPYSVERKRMDDLRSSIIDNRYDEQKFRLKNSGIKNLIYLVEDFGKGDSCFGKYGQFGGGGGGPGSRGNINMSTLNQAIANTAVQSGFLVHRTKDQKESVSFLTLMTRILNTKFSNLTLKSCTKIDMDENRIQCYETSLLTYDEMNVSGRKNRNFSTREIFSKMLLQLKGLTPGMAWAITELYPTPYLLKEAYRGKNDDKEIETLLKGLKYDETKKIPLSVSRTLGLMFTRRDLN